MDNSPILFSFYAGQSIFSTRIEWLTSKVIHPSILVPSHAGQSILSIGVKWHINSKFIHPSVLISYRTVNTRHSSQMTINQNSSIHPSVLNPCRTVNTRHSSQMTINQKFIHPPVIISCRKIIILHQNQMSNDHNSSDSQFLLRFQAGLLCFRPQCLCTVTVQGLTRK